MLENYVVVSETIVCNIRVAQHMPRTVHHGLSHCSMPCSLEERTSHAQRSKEWHLSCLSDGVQSAEALDENNPP